MNAIAIMLMAAIVTLAASMMNIVAQVFTTRELKRKLDLTRTKVSEKPQRPLAQRILSTNLMMVTSMLLVSYVLVQEYASNEPLTRQSVFEIVFAFSVLVFNVLSFELSYRLNSWIDGMFEMFEATFGLLKTLHPFLKDGGNGH